MAFTQAFRAGWPPWGYWRVGVNLKLF